MFVVTNRNIIKDAEGLDQVGSKPNTEGPNELRLFEATKGPGGWAIKIVPDKADEQMKAEVGLTEAKGVVYGSQYAAQKVLKRIQENRQNILFMVHGFNNNLESVLERAQGFAETYNVEVVPFSWPADGGGAKGVLSYKDDKRDARASVGALDRTLAKIDQYLYEFNLAQIKIIAEKARDKFPNNAELRDAYIAKMADQACPFTINMVLHSMGNYLFKHVLQSSISRGTRPVFDNVVMVAADTNNKDHAEWVDRILCRKRVYITINEDDAALIAARIKGGEEQLARLGQYSYELDSKQAVYVNLTGAPYVGAAHAYFEGSPLRNKAIKQFFKKAFNGQRAEEDLQFDQASGAYKPPSSWVKSVLMRP